MNKLYAKTVLYLYPCIDKVTEQIDDLLLKKALSSRNDFSPCLTQCEKMAELGAQNARLLELKRKVRTILKGFNEEERAILGYRYFRRGKSGVGYIDSYSRTYFRKQTRALAKFAEAAEEKDITDEKFEKEYLSVDFIRELYRRVKISEDNRKKKEIFGRPQNITVKPIKEALRA